VRWQDKKWGDLAILEYGKSLRGYQKAGGRYTVFGTNGPIGWHDEPLCPHATVVVGRKGAYRGVRYSPAPCYVIDTAFYLKPKVEFDMRWAYYELLTHDIDNMDSGSAIPSTSRDEFYQLPVRFPPLHEQRAIAHILGTLDDKIELNRRMNETLEAMARALFKSWFVDFDPVRAKAAGQTPLGLDPATAALFPGQFRESELGEIPEGWTIRALYDCADYVNGSAFRNEDFSPERLGLPVVKIGELKDGITAQTKFTEAILEPRYRISSGEILFSWSGSPDTSIDTFIWVGGDGWLNQHIFKVQFKRREEKFFGYYLLRHLKPIFVEIARNKQTTGLGHVTAQDLKRLRVTLPPDKALRAFNRLAEPLFQKVFCNLVESRSLAAVRDALLPKLLSGEIRVWPDPRVMEVTA
jgi:type I restriction enzyme S subunit